jgi:hypothetical protein
LPKASAGVHTSGRVNSSGSRQSLWGPCTAPGHVHVTCTSRFRVHEMAWVDQLYQCLIAPY